MRRKKHLFHLSLGFLYAIGLIISPAQAVTISLKPVSPDTIQFPWHWMSLDNEGDLLVAQEKIQHYPTGYAPQKNYFIDTQRNVSIYQDGCRNPDAEKRLKTHAPLWYQWMQDNYTCQTVDNLIAVALVKHPQQGMGLVIDQNNDEDLRNDKVFPLTTQKTPMMIHQTVTTEMVSQQKIKRLHATLSIREVSQSPSFNFEYSFGQIRWGEWQSEHDSYDIALMSEDLEFGYSNQLWIDTNQNHQWEQTDLFESSVTRPFTFDQASYVIDLEDMAFLDQMLIISPSQTPPIAVHLPAPDFKATTLAGKPFQLAKLKGSWVLLGFWGSGYPPSQREVPFWKKAVASYSDKNFKMVNIGVDNEIDLKKYIQEQQLNWTHIHQSDQGPLVQLYQIRRYPTTFLIDPKGNIAAMNEQVRGEQLLKTLQHNL